MLSVSIPCKSEYEYKLSVIVAAYNIAPYLDECLATLHKQKRSDVEFIIVDDGSTDASSSICDQWAARDTRFKIIHQENKGSLLARKTGVMHSSGQWIVFLDGDDRFADDALDRMCALTDACDADIIQFSIDVFNHTTKEQYNSAAEYINKHKMTILNNIEVCKSCFQKNLFSWTIWNKIYKSHLIKKTYEHIKDVHLVCAEDAYTFFIVTFFVSKFVIQKTPPLYWYRLNTGISTRKETIDLFTKHLSEITIIKYIREFLTAKSAGKAWFDACIALQTTLTNTAVYRMAALPEQDLSAGLSLFFDTYDPVIYFPALQNTFAGRQDELACAAHTAFRQIETRETKSGQSVPASTGKNTVGIFYHRYFNGGVERVISQQIPLFLKLGYRVILFTEQMCPEKEYPLPPEVIRVILPDSYAQHRADVFLAALHEYSVSVLCHHSASSPLLLFDLLLCRAARISTIVTRHEMVAQGMSMGQDYPFTPPTVFQLASTVCVLSSTEAYFYQQYGVNARYLPNPIAALATEPSDTIFHQQDRPAVVWIGRLSEEKNYKEALQVFKIISTNRNDIICYMIGSGDFSEKNYVKHFINKHKLQKNIIYIPYTLNVNQYYRSATVHLLTSSCESFAMVIAEGKIHALPLVTYALPWLELLKDGKGYISVHRHDMEGAASAVLSIISNSELRQRLSHEARESIQPFLQYDFAGAWKELLESPQKIQPGVYQGENPSNMHILCDHIFSMYREGRRRNSSESLNKESIKRILKNLPLIDSILPIGSRRREFVKKIIKELYHRIR